MTTRPLLLLHSTCAAVAAAVVLLTASPAAAQFFSPGPLSRAHASLEGLENCGQCHENKKGLSARLCLTCHTELQARVASGQGFHGRLPAAKKTDCASCHPDHRGLDAQMVDFEGGRDAFDHQKKVGWPLKGAHAKARCEACHQKPLIADGAVRRMLEKEPQRTTFLGASTRCASCHFDEHRGQLGNDCQRCHNETSWKPSAGFNHQSTEFPLLGKHRAVACAKCHPTTDDPRFATPRFAATAFPKPRASSFVYMKPVEHGTCESCHEDPHQGELGSKCAGCHSEQGWKIINANGQDTSFHDRTKFPLRGAHIAVVCKTCHGPFPDQPARFKGLPSAACTDCHEDAHLGQLRPLGARAKVPGCETCHTVASFSPPRFELEQHQKTRFPLDGAHGAVACRGCHPVDEGLSARIPTAAVQRLRKRKRPELFSLAVLRPKKVAAACTGCHEDVHHGQFRGEEATREAATSGGAASAEGEPTAGGGSGASSAGDNCTRCHKTTSFTDLRFNHDRDSRFSLTGRHAQAPCADCHGLQRVGAGPTFTHYKPLGSACRDCHADYHQGQFSAAGKVVSLSSGSSGDDEPPPPPPAARDCGFCHETGRFKDTLFRHDDPKFSSYPLEGKHANVACGRCHATVRLSLDVATVRYRPLPRACEECHADFHHGAFRGFEP